MTRPYYDYSEPRRVRLGQGWTPAVRGLVIASVAMAVVELMTWRAGVGEDGLNWVQRDLFLTPRAALDGGRPWQFLTHLFVVPEGLGGVWSLAATVILLAVFGCEVERRIGARRFVLFYLGCGLGSGAAAILWPEARIAGGDPAALGVAAAYALLWPNRPLYLFVVSVRTKWVVLVLLAMPALGAVAAAGRGQPAVALAELGGPAVAAAVWGLTRFRAPAPTAPRRDEDAAPPEVSSEEVDRILTKVHEHGIGSLTRGERRTLERASAELRRRTGRDRPRPGD